MSRSESSSHASRGRGLLAAYVAVVDRVPLAVLLLAPPAAVVLAVTVALLPARRAANLHPAEILHSE